MKTWKVVMSSLLLIFAVAIGLLFGGNIYFLICSIALFILTLVLVLIKPGGNLQMVNAKRIARNREIKILFELENKEYHEMLEDDLKEVEAILKEDE